MSRIVLNDEQAKQVASLLQPADVCDSQGNVLGTFTPLWTEADIQDALCRRAANEPGFSFQQVREHLRSLERP
jgi:hypothetical protein